MAKLEEIVIKNTSRIDNIVDKNEIMLQIRKQLGNNVEFMGWAVGYLVVRVKDKNYKIRYRQNYTILKETNDKNIKFLNRPKKIEAAERYKKILSGEIE